MPSGTTKAAYQKPAFMGKSLAVDENNFPVNFQSKLKVVAKTGDYTVLATESGTVFTTTGASGAVNFTLPAVAVGLWFEFIATVDFEMMVTGPTANELIAYNDATASSIAFTTASEHIGGGIEAICDGTSWIVTAKCAGTGAAVGAQAVTIA